MKRNDDIRPTKAVEVQCSKCSWCFWVDALHPALPSGPFVCHKCAGRTDVAKAVS